MSSNPSRRAFLATAAGSLAMAQQAQEAKPAQEAAQAPQTRRRRFSLDVTRVNVLFTVSDRKGRFVTNLVMEDSTSSKPKRSRRSGVRHGERSAAAHRDPGGHEQ